MANETGNTPANLPDRGLSLDDDTLASISSLDDALKVLSDAGIGATDIADLGDGFSVMDKSEFVNVPLVVLDWKFSSGDYGDEFAIMRIVTADGRKAVLTDGSTGIRNQLASFSRHGIVGGVIVKRGLTRSDYEYVDEKGKRTPASTFYLSM